MNLANRTGTRPLAAQQPGATLRERALGAATLVGGALVVASAGLHFHLWEVTYRHVPTIGPLFLLQALTGLLIGLAIVGSRRHLAAAAGAGFMAASAGGLVVATTSLGLFGFRESLAAPFAGLLLGIEFLGLVALAPAGVLGSLRVVATLRERRSAASPPVASPASLPVPAPVAPRPVVAQAMVSLRRGGSSSWHSPSRALTPVAE